MRLSNPQPTGDTWKSLLPEGHSVRSALRWEGLRWITCASVAFLLILSYFLSCLLPPQSASTWLSLEIKLQKLKWIQEEIFGLQVRIIIYSNYTVEQRVMAAFDSIWLYIFSTLNDFIASNVTHFLCSERSWCVDCDMLLCGGGVGEFHLI